MTDVYVVIKDGEPVYAALYEMDAENYVQNCIFAAEDEACEDLGYDEDDWSEQHMADVAFQAGFDESIDYDVMEVPDVFVTGIANPEDPDEEAWMSQSCDITHGSNVTIADLCREQFLGDGNDYDEPDDTDDADYYEHYDDEYSEYNDNSDYYDDDE